MDEETARAYRTVAIYTLKSVKKAIKEIENEI
jgi:hypothetical protein